MRQPTGDGDRPGGRNVQLRHGDAESVGDGSALGVGQPSESDDEFFAAEAADQILRPQFGVQAFRDGVQHLVTDQVTVGVVDGLEVIEVEDEHAGGLAGVAGPLQ